MNDNTNQTSCPMTCWIIAACTGLLVLILGLMLWDLMLMQALFFGGVIFIVLGFLLSWLFCSGNSGAHTASTSSARSADHGTTPVSAPSGASVASARAADASQTEAAPETVTQETVTQETVTEAAPETEPATSQASAPQPAAVADVKPVEIKPSAALAGEAELSSRKGTWKYQAETSDIAADTPAPATTEDSHDYDGDGVVEGTEEGTRPEALTAPRDGGADDLKRIKGIGPKLEILCNQLGFYHFDQIANWSADEVAWVNANLAGFKGRVTRDDWVAQAKLLASGQETEFSKRVDKGGVY